MSETFGFELYRYSEDNSSVLAWNKTCYTGYNIEPCGNLTDGDQQYHFSYTAIENVTEFLKIRFTLRISDVSADLNMSSFNCSVTSDDQIQWQHTATLTVTTAVNDFAFPLQAVVASCVLIPLVIIICLVMTMCIVLAKKKTTKRNEALQPDQGKRLIYHKEC